LLQLGHFEKKLFSRTQDIQETKMQDNEENYIMRTAQFAHFRQLNWREWNVLDTLHPWEGWEMHTTL